MKIQVFTLALLMTNILSMYAQPFQLKLNWKVGDTRILHGEVHEREYENGALTKDTSEYHEMEISVLKESKNEYFINIRQENIALRNVWKFFDKAGHEELVKYKDLNLEYSINKKTGKATLENWKESKTYVINSMKTIETYMQDKMPGHSSTVKMLFMPIKMGLNTKKEVEAYFNNEVNYLEYPYGQKVNLYDTTIVQTKDVNPIGTSDSLTTTIKSVVKNLNKSSKHVEVWQTLIIDFADYKETLKKMMKDMMLSLEVPDSTVQKNTKEIDEFEMDVDTERIVTYNYETSWPVKLEVNSHSLFQAPGKKSEAYKTVKANFK